MCGENFSAQDHSDRFGALAVLSPLPDADIPGLSGRIVFFNNHDHDCQVATHMRFSPSGPLDSRSRHRLFVKIHESGDLTIPYAHSGISASTIELQPAPGPGQHGAVLRQLEHPLHLHVGHDRHGNRGIIGRRVSLCWTSDVQDPLPATEVLAEGIVGYNQCS